MDQDWVSRIHWTASRFDKRPSTVSSPVERELKDRSAHRLCRTACLCPVINNYGTLVCPHTHTHNFQTFLVLLELSDQLALNYQCWLVIHQRFWLVQQPEIHTVSFRWSCRSVDGASTPACCPHNVCWQHGIKDLVRPPLCMNHLFCHW